MTYNNTYMKLIEEISLNAWPSHKIELYDGWLLRFSHNYTYRTNSVEQVGISSISIEEKIAYCEAVYKEYHTPTNFKINPLMDPDFDLHLDHCGYHIKHITEVMTMSLKNFQSSITGSLCNMVQLRDKISDEWIHSLFHLNGTTNPTLLRIVPSMFKAIPKETIVAFIEIDGQTIASGLGILDRDHIGLYAIYVEKSYRRQNFARALCSSILAQAQERGVKNAYLQVVKGNAAAKTLYTSLGFQDLYTYWFRSK